MRFYETFVVTQLSYSPQIQAANTTRPLVCINTYQSHCQNVLDIHVTTCVRTIEIIRLIWTHASMT